MSITRWPAPVGELGTMRESMARLFDDPFFRAPFGALLGQKPPELPLEILEAEDAITVRAPVPGFRPEAIDVELQGTLLTLRGTVEEQHEESKGSRHLAEWQAASFQRSVELPAAVDADRAAARFVNGVLELHLPKLPDHVARKIEVQA
jgi:HSP20 family protein